MKTSLMYAATAERRFLPFSPKPDLTSAPSSPKPSVADYTPTTLGLPPGKHVRRIVAIVNFVGWIGAGRTTTEDCMLSTVGAEIASRVGDGAY